jgi:pyruvate formate lyase activating enzyme
MINFQDSLKFINLPHLIFSDDRKTEIPFHDATPWKKAVLLSHVLQFLISCLIRFTGADDSLHSFSHSFPFISIYFHRMNGLIFSVKRYSIHDGPGIRVTFFMKGCPLSCKWCHNPEGISAFQETVLKTDRVGDMEFIKQEKAGNYFTVENILEILEKEKVFINQSNGGVTFSGGEPMLQTDFLLAVLKACKTKGYHTAVDTSGYSSMENYQAIIPFTDLFLFDIKHLDEANHLESTGVTNSGILDNYLLIINSGKDVMIRIPVIPGFNDDQDHLERLKQFIAETKTVSVIKINLLPFHKIGASKYKRFNLPYRMRGIEPPGKEKMEMIKELFQETGIKVKIGG